MSSTIRALKAKKAAALQAAQALNAITDRDLTDAERTALAGHIDNVKGLNAQIEQAEFLANEEAGIGALGAMAVANAGSIQVSENIEQDPKRGFRSFGDFAKAVISGNSTRPDKRLLIGAAAPGTASNEGAGADGGFQVPPEYSRELFRLSLGEDSLLPYTSNVNVEGNSMVFPKTEQTPWGSTGVRAYWQNEAVAGAATKLALGTQALRLHKLMALCPVTDELMSDATALATEIPGLVGDALRWKANESILFGNGNGQPLGALTSTGPVVTHAKDSGQAANTLSVSNLFGMISRLPNVTKGTWMIHPTVIPVLGTLVLGQIPVFLPGGSVNTPLGPMPVFGFLLGRPVIVSHHCAALSSAGDVQLHDFSYYRTITKAEGVRMDTSMHLYFDADAMALRLTFRLDGSPKIAAPISPAKGSTTLSPFVQLQNR